MESLCEENLSPFLSLFRSFTLHQLVSRAGRLVIIYCVLRGPVHRHRPKQTAAPQVKEIDKVPHTAMTAQRKHKSGIRLKTKRILNTHILFLISHLNGLSMDVAVTLKCLYRLAFILSFVVMPRTAI